MTEKHNSTRFRILVALNVVLFLLTTVLVLNKLGIFVPSRFISKSQEYSYLDNAQYNASLTMFKLNTDDCDVVFVGDSITARCHFDELLNTDKSVLNRGIDSDTVEGMLNRTDEILSHHPSSVFIMGGINDVWHKIPHDETLAHYRSMISKIKDYDPSINIYIQSVLPVCNHPIEDTDSIIQINSLLSALAEEQECTYLDVYSHFMNGNEPNAQNYSMDGVHLNGTGYKTWLEFIKPYL